MGHKKTRHHILPKSRGGKNNRENIIKVERKLHSLYHMLFDNKTPNEILGCLDSLPQERPEKFYALFQDKTTDEIINELKKNWGFNKYFKAKQKEKSK